MVYLAVNVTFPTITLKGKRLRTTEFRGYLIKKLCSLNIRTLSMCSLWPLEVVAAWACAYGTG